jgi:hypothetical protein
MIQKADKIINKGIPLVTKKEDINKLLKAQNRQKRRNESDAVFKWIFILYIITVCVFVIVNPYITPPPKTKTYIKNPTKNPTHPNTCCGIC